MPQAVVNESAIQAIPWAVIFAKIKLLIAQYGPLAVPYIEQFLAGLGLPAWVLIILDHLIEQLLGPQPTPVPKLNAANCQVV